mgnify:FL=1
MICGTLVCVVVFCVVEWCVDNAERVEGEGKFTNLVIEGIIEKVRPVGVSLHESVLEEFLQAQP